MDPVRECSVDAIETTKLAKSFGERVAVDDLDLVVRQGEVFALLGPNGAGKTTTIKMLCCLTMPSSGAARVMGHDIVTDSHVVKQLIAVSPQETAIAPNLTARENLALIAGLHGVDADDSRARADELLEMTGLAHRGDDKAKRFSGGMQRRLSIAMALVSEPAVVFLDEPTIGLDPQSRRRMWDYIEGLKGRTTVVLTTHYLEEADALADRVAVIDQGGLAALGTPEELKERVRRTPVTIVEAPDLCAEALAALRRVYPTARPIDGGVEIEAEHVSLYDIGDCLRPFGVEITATSKKPITLDDVFLELTGRATRE